MYRIDTTASTKDELKKVKMGYEKQISDMQKKLKTLQGGQREHQRQQREIKAHEMKINHLRNELGVLKTAKVCDLILANTVFKKPCFSLRCN